MDEKPTASPRVTVEKAEIAMADELEQLQKRNASFHEPWVYHGEVAQYFKKISSGRTIGMFVKEKDSGALIGVINLNEPVMGALRSAYLGYYIDKEFAGRGYMSEGLVLVLREAFQHMQFHRLEANIQPRNRRSIELVERLGFRQEGYSPKYLKINGQWKDHERWAMLVEDWQELQQPE